MSDKEEIRRDQKAMLDRVNRDSGLTLTEIAERCKIASTTLTRFYNSKDAKHVLSSTTLNKIRKHFPIKEGKAEISDGERALTSAMMILVQCAFSPKPAPKRSFIAALLALEKKYKDSPAALEILRNLNSFVSNEMNEPPPEEKEIIESFLPLHHIDLR